MYRWVVGDLRTGRIGKTIDVSGTWSTVFDAADTLSNGFPIFSYRNIEKLVGFGEGYFGMGPFGEAEVSQTKRYVWPDALSDSTPAKAFFAVAWVDQQEHYEVEHWRAGGPIWAQGFKRSTGLLGLGGAGMESYYDHRYVLPVLEPGISPAEVATISPTSSLSQKARELVAQAHSWTAGAPPVVLPSIESLAGKEAERNYPGYELGKVGQRLRQLAEVENGPEIQFAPRRRSDDPRFMEWVMRIGTEATNMQLAQTGPAWKIDATVPKSMLVDYDWSSDGSVLLTDAYAAGMGQGEGRPIAVSSSTLLTDAGFLRLEGEKQATDNVSDMSTLQSHSDGFLSRRGRPFQKLTITVDAQMWWRHAAASRAGDWLEFRTENETGVPDGLNDLRILKMSANDESTVELECMTKREAVSA